MKEGELLLWKSWAKTPATNGVEGLGFLQGGIKRQRKETIALLLAFRVGRGNTEQGKPEQGRAILHKYKYFLILKGVTSFWSCSAVLVC